MDDLLEGLFEPAVEGLVGFVIGAPRSIAENGWTEATCRVQTLLNSVWWNADEMRGTDGRAPSALGSLISLVLTLAGLRWKVKPT
jgi:hypothetical protein